MHDHIMDWGKFWVVHIHSYFFKCSFDGARGTLASGGSWVSDTSTYVLTVSRLKHTSS